MAPGVQVLLSGALTFGVPMILAASELWRGHPRPDDGWDRQGPVSPRVRPPTPGGEQHRPALPACLLRAAQGLPPAVHAEQTRVPELA